MPEDKSLYCILFLTRRCNIDCSYCHMEHDGYEDMPKERLKHAIDMFLAVSPNVCLHLFGGEPTLRFDLIEWIVDYVANEYGDKRDVKYMITTNGLLLRGSVLDFLLQHRVQVMLSLDGSFDSQKDWRRTIGGDARKAYDRILENLAELNRRGADYFVNMVVSPENVEQMEENVLHFKRLGVKRLQVTYELGAYWCEPFRSQYVKNFRYVIEKYNERSFVLQHGPSSEPVLGNMTFIVDVNGDMYRGCAVVLEKTMPRFNEVVRIPNLDTLENLTGYVRTREEQVRDFLRRTRIAENDYRLLKSNMHLGYLLRREMFDMAEVRAAREAERRATGS